MRLTFLFLLLSFFAFGQTRDSIYWSIDTVKVKYDSIACQTFHLQKDSIYPDLDTLKIPVAVPVAFKGMYTHPNQVTIGNSTSENTYLTWCKREGVNMLNCYARSYLYDETKRTQLAAFVAKAKNSYGIILVTVDVRFTDSREQGGWEAYLLKYNNTISSIEPLTEFEPYIKNSAGVYDYAGFFNLVRTMGGICKKYGIKLNYYEGWVGNNYNGLSFSQAPVDSMVKYCDRIFLSNYVTVSSYTADKWAGGMDKRCNYIAVGCQHVGKSSIDIVEIVSLERTSWGAASEFLGSYFVTHSFYGSSYTESVNAYNTSTPLVLQYTDVVGRTCFYSKYCLLAHP